MRPGKALSHEVVEILTQKNLCFVRTSPAYTGPNHMIKSNLAVYMGRYGGRKSTFKAILFHQ